MPEVKMKDIIGQSFTQYAGAVLQSRALVDARDFCKPSARQVFYCMNDDGFTHNKPYKKTLKAIGSGMRMYIHGDASLEGIIMRSSQAWNMRYPLVEVEGSNGNPIESGNWAAPRYTASRLTDLATYLFRDIDKSTIDEWRDNYDDTEQYPAVLPSKGFYNLVNGTTGIGVSLASSVPQFNLVELNKALIHLLNNPNCSFDDIYCVPDFASGGILMNEKEVKESLRTGTGKACIVRSVMDYDAKDNCLIVTEIPPTVYTNTICGQLEALLEDPENPGIERFNDLTGKTPNIKIYLRPNTNPQKVKNYLYSSTSLQYFYGINLTMLGEKGRFPRTYTWKEMLEEHLAHEKEVYRRGFEFDLAKIDKRLHIIEGLLKAIDMMDEVIATIKKSADTKSANAALRELLSIDEEQAKAILDIKLSRLAHLEIVKLENERADLVKEQERISSILNNTKLFNKEVENGFAEVAKKFGDARRTQIAKASATKEEEEVANIVPENCVVVVTENGNIKRVPSKNYKAQRRNGKGVKSSKDSVLAVIQTNTVDHLLIFTMAGRAYRISVDDIPSGTNSDAGVSIMNLVAMDTFERVSAVASMTRSESNHQYVWFITKNGLIKKTGLSEYSGLKRKAGIVATGMREGDSLAKVFISEDKPIILFTTKGMCLRMDGKALSASSRTSSGVKGIALAEGDSVVDAIPAIEGKDVLIVGKNGAAKRLLNKEFITQTRGGKGVICFKNQEVVGVASVDNETQVLILGDKNTICVSASDINMGTRASTGVMTIKDNVVNGIVAMQER